MANPKKSYEKALLPLSADRRLLFFGTWKLTFSISTGNFLIMNTNTTLRVCSVVLVRQLSLSSGSIGMFLIQGDMY